MYKEINKFLIVKGVSCGVVTTTTTITIVYFFFDRLGHDLRYVIDVIKLKIDFGWTLEETFETGMMKTVA